jgi:hypothetical protein
MMLNKPMLKVTAAETFFGRYKRHDLGQLRLSGDRSIVTGRERRQQTR